MLRPRDGSPDDAARIVVERARVSDVPVVAPLFEAYRQFYGWTPDRAASTRFLALRLERDESVVLLARVRPSPGKGQGPAAGFAQLYPSFSSVALAPILILNDLFVADEYRQRGVGRRLLDEAAAYSARAGAVRLEIATHHANHRALRLYEARGFVRETEFTRLSLKIGPSS
jgi:ribosomal protein S18 acetylase RimI-like enzyme